MSDFLFSRRFTPPDPSASPPPLEYGDPSPEPRTFAPSQGLVRWPEDWGRTLLATPELPGIPLHVDASVITTPEGMLVRASCCCGARWERLIDERPLVWVDSAERAAAWSADRVVAAIAALRESWAPRHHQCDMLVSSWSDREASGGGTVAWGPDRLIHDQGLETVPLETVPPEARFLAVVHPVLVWKGTQAATACAQALAAGARPVDEVGLIVWAENARWTHVRPSDDEEVGVRTFLAPDLAPPGLRDQLPAGMEGAAALCAFNSYLLRQKACEFPNLVIGAYAVTTTRVGPASNGSSASTTRVRTRAARRLARRQRHVSASTAQSDGWVVEVEIVTPTVGGRLETQPIRPGDHGVEPRFAMDWTKPPRSAHLHGVLAQPFERVSK